MRGSGLKGVCLVAAHEGELFHPMTLRLLKRCGLQETDVCFATSSEANLFGQAHSRNVRVFASLGEQALGQLLGEADVERWRGRVKQCPTDPSIWVVPMFAPSRLMSYRGGDEDDDAMRHPPRFHGIWMRDMHFALRVAKEGFTRMPVNYLVDPSADRFAAFADEWFALRAADPTTRLSWDIETFYSKHHKNEDEFEVEGIEGEILRVSFCFIEGYAASVPWSPTYEPTVRRLLASQGINLGWNISTFDVPVVTTAGYPVVDDVHDGMDAYHLIQSDLPKGLEWVSAEASDLLPWKHLSQAEPGWYSCTDADAALRNMHYIDAVLERQGQTRLFRNHVVRLMPLLDRAGQHGNLMDVVKRDEIRTKLLQMKQELVDEAQGYVPRELFPRTTFKRQPEGLPGVYGLAVSHQPAVSLPGWDIIWERSQEKVCSHCGAFASNKTEHFKGSLGEPHPRTGKPTRIKNSCREAGATIDAKPAFTPRFDRLEPFNPNSSDQMKAYMRHFGHPIGKDKRDSTKETADASHLKALHKKVGKKFPLYKLSLQLHKALKTIGTYTPEPDANNILHTQYVNSTSTWRLGSRKVLHGTQIQNWGKRGSDDPESLDGNKYAKEARKQIIARPGHSLVQIDSSAVEAVMQGYYMNDPLYMKIASQSIHAWLACRALGLEFNPDNVDKVKKDHEGLYMKMKTTNYLTNFGGGDYLLWQSFPEQFPTRAAATAAQDSLFALLPTLKAYHHSVRWEAHTKTYLTTPWGYRHWFYDVFKQLPDGTLGHGKDAKRTVAFKPQNSNGAFQKDNLLLLGFSPIEAPAITSMDEFDRRWDELKAAFHHGDTWGRYMPTAVSIHDSAQLDTPDPLVERATAAQLAIFTRPIPEMRGLRIGAEVEVGKNWGQMERVAKVVVDDYTHEHTEAGLAVAA